MSSIGTPFLYLIHSQVDLSEQSRHQGSSQAPAVINNYNAPAVTNYSSHAQIAWDAESITQHSEHQENVAAGFGEFAQCLAQILADIDMSAIEEEKQKFRTVAEQTLQETNCSVCT